MKIKFSLILLLAFGYDAIAQGIETQISERYNEYRFYNTVENAYLKVDKRIYYNGGEIKFYLTILDQYLTPTSLSEVVYLEMFNEDNTFHETYVFRLNQGVISGSIDLPITAPTGNYQLVAYTKYMRNFDVDESSYRVPLYIQNTLDPSRPVVKSIDFESNKDGVQKAKVAKGLQSNYSLRHDESSDKLFVEIGSSQKTTAYLVSEGFRSLQFVAKVKLKKGYTSVSFSKDRLKGNFQKLILLDENLEIIALHNYFLKSNGKPTFNFDKTGDNVFSVNVKNNSITGLQLSEHEPIGFDGTDMFRHIYRLYYNIPSSHQFSTVQFDELTSSSFLNNYAHFSYDEWNAILDEVRSDSAIEIIPEKNIRLEGKVEGENEKLLETTLALHFFNNEMDIYVPLDTSGVFTIDLLLPVGKDHLFATVHDKYSRDISDGFDINIRTFPEMSYYAPKAFFDQSLTDSVIERNNEFNYILSTFNEIPNDNTYFWSNLSFDLELLISDYTGLESVEDFMREAAMNVSVVNEKGVKSLNMYNSKAGNFESPQLMAVNDMVIDDSSPLFQIPISSITSVNLIYTKEKLLEIGAPFTKGILLIEADKSISLAEKFRNPGFMSFNGYYYSNSENDLINKFGTSKLMLMSSENNIASDNRYSEKNDELLLIIESLSKEGYYSNYSSRISED